VGATRAVPTGVGPLVDVAVLPDPGEDLLDAELVAGVRGPDEEVVGRVEAGRERPEAFGVAIGQLLGTHAELLGSHRDRLAVLVGPSQEEDLLPALAHVPGEDVRGDRRVRVAEVGRRVDVVDRRGYVEGHPIYSVNPR